MRIKFWGTRGSLPSPLTAQHVHDKVVQALAATRGQNLPMEEAELSAWVTEHLPFALRGTFGGNTACVQVGLEGGDYLLLDAGTGLRDFAQDYRVQHRHGSKPGFPSGGRFHIFLSHLHWDHLQGLPFFYPIYAAGQHITLYGAHDKIEEAVRAQFSTPFFPVPYEFLKATIDYQKLAPGQEYDIAGAKVRLCAQNHPGVAYGYRFEQGGKTFVYSTDGEHKQAEAAAPDYPLLKFYANADLLVFDAMYSLEEAVYSKADWGHSSNVIGVELAARAQVRRLALFHHDPHSGDAELEETQFNTRMYAELYHQEMGRKLNGPEKFPMEIVGAYDGLEVQL
ncbi:MAG TPA: MBL fold metallo-hydrolase [Opitutales bacterium]|nr:MBL fold metallo-hydrolase [Opitutales bacterium]